MQSKVPSLAPEQPLDLNTSLTEFQKAFGLDGPLGELQPLPVGTSAYDQEVQKQKVQESTSVGDYTKSIFRQDSPVDGMVGWYVGDQYKPDDKFDPWGPQVKELQKGLPEEYANELHKAVSMPHALYLRERLDDKLGDQQKLASLGAAGNTARFLAGFVEPTNLALGLASGGTTTLASGVATRAAIGLATGAGTGYAFERMRQRYNFEDSQPDAVWAGLMGLAFSAPFVGLHAHEMVATRRAAGLEREVLSALHEGTPLTEATANASKEIEARRAELAPEYNSWPPEAENAPVERAAPEAQADFSPDTMLEEHLLGERQEAPVEREVGEVPGFLPGSVGSAQIREIPMELSGMSRLRFDIYARLNRSENPVVQRMAQFLIKDGIAARDVEGNAIAQPRTASEDKKVLQRTLGGGFHFAAHQAYDEMAQRLKLGWWERNKPSNVSNFYEKIGRAMRDERVYAENPDIAPELRKAVGASREVYGRMLEEMNASGVHGAEALKANPDYMNRVWKQSAIREMERTHGEGTVKRLVSQSIRDKDGLLTRFREKNPTSTLADHEVLEQSAGKFLSSVMKLEHSHLSTEMLMSAHEAPTLRAELSKKLSSAEAESVIDALFEHQEATNADAGKPAPLKYRFNLDEATRITGKDGAPLRLTDLFENDSRLLVDRYLNSMAGHVALARRGIKSRAEFNALIRQADANNESEGLGTRDAHKFAEEKDLLNDMYNHVVGRPMSVQSFNTGDRVAGISRAYARSVYLGQLGFTAAHEAFHAAGLSTWRAALQQMPALREFWAAAKAGHTPTEGLANDMRLMLGFLNEHVSAYARQHELTDHTYDNRLKSAENTANKLSHAVDKFSGNSFTTSFTRGYAAAWMTQKYANFAHGTEALTKAWRDRIVGSGVHDADIERMLAALKEHSNMDGKRVAGVRWEDWSAKDPRSYHDFTTAVDRDVRQAIQDHDIGETWMFQHTAVGKIFTELRAFNIAGHVKQMLNSLHYRDRLSMQLWTTSFVVNAMSYVTQTSMNYGHDPAQLEKRLTAERIVKAAYTRSNMLGIVPFISDTLVPGFVSPFAQTSGQGLTANTDSRNALMPPSFNLIAKGVNFMQNGKPSDGFSILPGSNTYGARNLGNWLNQAYPNTKPH